VSSLVYPSRVERSAVVLRRRTVNDLVNSCLARRIRARLAKRSEPGTRKTARELAPNSGVGTLYRPTHFGGDVYDAGATAGNPEAP
jgi:hypothetical protein